MHRFISILLYFSVIQGSVRIFTEQFFETPDKKTTFLCHKSLRDNPNAYRVAPIKLYHCSHFLRVRPSTCLRLLFTSDVVVSPFSVILAGEIPQDEDESSGRLFMDFGISYSSMKRSFSKPLTAQQRQPSPDEQASIKRYEEEKSVLAVMRVQLGTTLYGNPRLRVSFQVLPEDRPKTVFWYIEFQNFLERNGPIKRTFYAECRSVDRGDCFAELRMPPRYHRSLRAQFNRLKIEYFCGNTLEDSQIPSIKNGDYLKLSFAECFEDVHIFFGENEAEVVHSNKGKSWLLDDMRPTPVIYFSKNMIYFY